MTPEQRRLRAQAAAYALHAAYDSRELTKAARAAFNRRFELQVDPDGVLPEQERARRAEMARRAHFRRLALASSRKRAKARGRANLPEGERADG